MCHKKITDIILGIIVIAFALYQTTYSKWIIIIAGAVLIIHSVMCRCCSNECNMPMSMKTSMTADTKSMKAKK